MRRGPLASPHRVLDVPRAPDAVLATVRGAINRRERRLFGIIKTKQEFVGHVFDDGFEIWERQQRAVHVVGLAHARRGGTRVELRFVLAPVTRVVAVVFFALYFAGTIGLSLREPEPAVSGVEAAATLLGAAVLAGGFTYAARRQRADLDALVMRLLDPDTKTGQRRPPDDARG